jgi:chromatin assembly factor 1 subunit B
MRTCSPIPTSRRSSGTVVLEVAHNLLLLLTFAATRYTHPRRVTWSPDGSLVIAPTGIYRPPATVTAKTSAGGASANSYCTHLFSRSNLSSPCVSLVGLEEPSVAVRCCPRPYKLVSHPSSTSVASMIPGPYRFVFAVVTLGSVFVYDTQHAHPIAKFSGLHYAPINDVAWSADGRVLAACSSDGYLSFFRFEEGALGTSTTTALPLSFVSKFIATAY